MQSGDWTTLEIVKLVAGLLTPLALAALGVYLHRVTKQFEHTQWRSQKLIEKRLAVYDSLAPKLNDVYCYFICVGGWRDISPPTIVALKRVIDKEIHLAAPLFSKDFFDALLAFQDACFQTYNEWGRDARLRTEFARRKEHYPQDWQATWESLFTDNVSSSASVKLAYSRAMHVFSKDIGVQEIVGER